MKSQPQNHNYHRQVHVLREEKGLRVDKVQPISKENFEVVEKIKTCNKLLNWSLKIPPVKNLMKR